MASNVSEETKSVSIQAPGGAPSGAKKPLLTAETAKSKQAENFSQVIAVLMRDRNFRNTRLGELEWLVLPPLLTGQWRLGQVGTKRKAGDNAAGVALVPVAVALWARVSDAVDQRLSTELDKPLFLAPNEWTSGDNLWLIAIAGDPRAMPKFLGTLRDHEFKGRDVKLRSAGPEGKAIVSNLSEFMRVAKL